MPYLTNEQLAGFWASMADLGQTGEGVHPSSPQKSRGPPNYPMSFDNSLPGLKSIEHPGLSVTWCPSWKCPNHYPKIALATGSIFQ